MARKYSPKKRKSKIEPAVLTMSFATTTTGTGVRQRTYVDLSQAASLMNRRFYRQGINWAVSGMKVTSAQPGTVTVSKLPNTWVTSNAWEKAFRAWNKQQMEYVEQAGAESGVAAFRDFKVFADTTHVDQYLANGSDLNATNLMPVAIAPTGLGVTATGGEWEPSQIVVPNLIADASGSLVDPFEYLLHMVGTNGYAGISRGVLEGYADSRAYPQSPDPVSPALDSDQNWLQRMFDVGNDGGEIVDNATDKNDNLPYPQVSYPGGQNQLEGLEWHDFTQIYATSATTNVGIARLKGGNFPCGLIAIDWTPSGDDSANLVIQIDLVPGNHRGYLCEPMTEM
jgi:hypothetical protein